MCFVGSSNYLMLPKLRVIDLFPFFAKCLVVSPLRFPQVSSCRYWLQVPQVSPTLGESRALDLKEKSVSLAPHWDRPYGSNRCVLKGAQLPLRIPNGRANSEFMVETIRTWYDVVRIHHATLTPGVVLLAIVFLQVCHEFHGHRVILTR